MKTVLYGRNDSAERDVRIPNIVLLLIVLPIRLIGSEFVSCRGGCREVPY